MIAGCDSAKFFYPSGKPLCQDIENGGPQTHAHRQTLRVCNVP